MGCDIHLYTEVLTQTNGELKWRSADRFTLNPYYNADDESCREREYEVESVYGKRNYTLFSALAGVRNYGNEVPIIAKPKGIPEDCCKIIKEYNDRWDTDGHSHSYLTLSELYNYVDTQSNIVTYKGMVSPEAAKQLDNNGTAPTIWCQMTSMQDWVHREWNVELNVFEGLIKSIEKLADKELWISHRQDGERIPPEQAERIRIVFWFDN